LKNRKLSNISRKTAVQSKRDPIVRPIIMYLTRMTDEGKKFKGGRNTWGNGIKKGDQIIKEKGKKEPVTCLIQSRGRTGVG